MEPEMTEKKSPRKKKEPTQEVPQETTAMIIAEDVDQDMVVRRENLLKEVDGLFSAAQRNWVMQETPKYKIRKRKGRGGMMYDYVDVAYIIEQLNYATGFKWSNTVHPNGKDPHYCQFMTDAVEKWGQFVVTVTLTLEDRKNPGQYVTHEHVGRAEIKMLKDSKKPLDIGNDLKAAESDGIKKAASLFGFSLDVYSGAVTRAQDETNPDGVISDGMKRRLEVLANEAGIGHTGLRKIIAEMYDYESTKKILRKHFQSISDKLESIQAEASPAVEIPADIAQGFEILGTPKAKQIAVFISHSKKGPEGIEELRKKINAKVDAQAAKPANDNPSSKDGEGAI